MPKYLSNLFTSNTIVYSYTIAPFIIKEEISSVLSKSGSFFSERDFTGQMHDNLYFTISVNSPVFTGGIRFGSSLLGKIVKKDSNHSDIEIKFKPSLAIKLFAVISFLGGIAILDLAIVHSSFENVLIGIAIMLMGPIICNWVAGISNSVIQSRYNKYIHKPLSLKHQVYLW